MHTRRTFFGATAAALTATLMSTTSALAADVTLSMEHMLPAQATVPTEILQPWADRIEAESNGRIEVEIYPSMQLGGSPPELFDHVQDGIIDVGWTVVGYTPGRFPRSEVFELPFMVEDARAASYAYAKISEEQMQDADFADVKVIGTWVHGPGLFHTNKAVNVPSDLEGMKIRGGSRLVNDLLTRVGAEPIGMPVPAVSEALSKGVLDGTTIPWEVTPALKVAELVSHHTEFDGPALYTLTFVMAMNKDVYESMDEDLQKVINDNSGVAFSIFAGGTQADADVPARQVAVDLGNDIIVVSEEDAQEWDALVNPIYETWIADMESKGIDGQALIDEAKALMGEYDPSMDTWGQ
ncbi:TRAP transporter substrate-binding protein [Sagittula sp. NFXS13]|uniref:TRAP transporter substrate-binding protein n=1 Tax=Sagittula sp. NFXS13 TaxID=2819095 RepID=UPI0032DF4123